MQLLDWQGRQGPHGEEARMYELRVARRPPPGRGSRGGPPRTFGLRSDWELSGEEESWAEKTECAGAWERIGAGGERTKAETAELEWEQKHRMWVAQTHHAGFTERRPATRASPSTDPPRGLHRAPGYAHGRGSSSSNTNTEKHTRSTRLVKQGDGGGAPQKRGLGPGPHASEWTATGLPPGQGTTDC